MAVEGQKGRITLSREWPAPTVLADQRLQRGASPSLDLNQLAFQSGDEVLLVALRGVPGGVGIDGAAPCPAGHAFYPGGENAVGPALARRLRGGSFYGSDASRPFYESAATVGFEQTMRAYIHRDEMDDVRLYATELDAINGGDQGLIPLQNVSPGPMLILPASDRAGYEAAAVALLQSIVAADTAGVFELNVFAPSVFVNFIDGRVMDIDIPNGEQPAENLASVPAVLTETAADVEERGWLVQCDLTGWVFEMNADQLDQAAIGQAFGESAKGMLRGAGSFSGEIDHSRIANEQSGLGMVRLMMLTGQGSKARARFQMVDQRSASMPLVRERVFYETDILLGQTNVDTKPTDVILFTAQFIATGSIRLVAEGP